MDKKLFYWFTSSPLNHIDLKDKTFKDPHHISKKSLYSSIKAVLSKLFKKKEEDLDKKEKPVLLKAIEINKYEIIEKGEWSSLIYMFNYYLFEEKFALKIMDVSDNKIYFQKVDIFKNGHLLKDKIYYKPIELKKIELEEYSVTKIEENIDEIRIVPVYGIFFSFSLKNKLLDFVKTNYSGYRFVPGIPSFKLID